MFDSVPNISLSHEKVKTGLFDLVLLSLMLSPQIAFLELHLRKRRGMHRGTQKTFFSKEQI